MASYASRWCEQTSELQLLEKKGFDFTAVGLAVGGGFELEKEGGVGTPGVSSTTGTAL